MESLLTVDGLIALLTLSFLEVVLGIDNIIFISIVAGKLPENKQAKARSLGLSLALIMRIGLLLCISYIIGLTKPWLTIFSWELSGRDIILALGGLFLLYKSSTEIHKKVEEIGIEESKKGEKSSESFSKTIIQIVLIDAVFSFDSILTAVGLTHNLVIMITAVIISMVIMMFFSGTISQFIHKHPTLQILALSFLILIGFMLMVEALHYHVPKGYIYFAVLFSLLVEMLNMRMRKRKKKTV